MQKIDYHELASQLVETARRAGKVQLDIYASDFQVDYKEDSFPGLPGGYRI